LKTVQDVEDKSLQLKTAADAEAAAGVKAKLDALIGSLRELEAIFNERKNVILGLTT